MMMKMIAMIEAVEFKKLTSDMRAVRPARPTMGPELGFVGARISLTPLLGRRSVFVG
jgi:hypothetical protein